MTPSELRSKIKALVPDVYKNTKKANKAFVEYDELTKFPELKAVIVDLLTSDFDKFLASINWVAPHPTTFRIDLKNNQDFYLIYNRKSWIAQIEGKKYYLLDLPEAERATEAIARILRYGSKIETKEPQDLNNTSIEGIPDFDEKSIPNTEEPPSNEEPSK